MKKIAYITDLHMDEGFTLDEGADPRKNLEVILNDLRERGIKSIVFGGDIGTKESNQWFFDQLKDFDLCITLGNHDTFDEAVKYFDPSLPKTQEGMYYSKENEEVKFVFLDSSTGMIDEEQFRWFQKALHTSKPIVIFIHHPILETGTTPQREFPWESPGKLKEELLKIPSPVTIFCGHLHLLNETTESNITQYVTPSAAVQIKPDSEKTEIEGIDFGYRIISFVREEIGSQMVWFNKVKM